MDWANERYVRIYTRVTADDQVMSWQARALWPLLVTKADRAGVIATNHGARGIAALVGWPADVAAPAFAELLEDGRIQECHQPRGYVIPNYIPAQETPSSDGQRKRDERERRRDVANNSVTKRDAEVTIRDEMSRAVTRSHAESRAVTPCLTVPDRSDPCLAVQEIELSMSAPPTSRGLTKAKGAKGYTEAELASVRVVLDKLGERSGIAYRGGTKHTALIVARLREGTSEWDLRRITGYCAERLGWETKPEMKAYLRPETLFGPQTIEKYLDAARTWAPQSAPTEQPSASGGVQIPQVPQLRLVGPDDGDTDFSNPRWEEPSWMTASK